MSTASGVGTRWESGTGPSLLNGLVDRTSLESPPLATVDAGRLLHGLSSPLASTLLLVLSTIAAETGVLDGPPEVGVACGGPTGEDGTLTLGAAGSTPGLLHGIGRGSKSPGSSTTTSAPVMDPPVGQADEGK
jgi:hypothetical protein